MFRRNPVAWLACAAALITHPAAAQIHFEGGYLDLDQYVFIGFPDNAPGTATVTGDASRGYIFVGALSEGTLNIQSGGALSGSRVFLGGEQTGNMVVNNGGSLSVSGLSVGSLYGSGHVDINGGTVNVSDLFSVGDGTGPSSVNLHGGTLEAGRAKVANGSVVLDGGTFSVGGDMKVGDNAAGSLVLMDGSVSVGGTFYVGNGHDGTVTIEGGSLNTNDSWIGGFTSNGTAKVTGGNWTVSTMLYLGMLNSSGTLEISGSGAVSAIGVMVGQMGDGVLRLNGGSLSAELVQVGYTGENGSGSVELNGGTMHVVNVTAYALSTASRSFVWNGGTLKLVGSQGNLFDGFATENAQVRIDANGGLLDTSGGDAIINVGIQGTGALHKLGEGTLTFTTSQAYTGGTIVHAGQLIFSGDGGFASPDTSLIVGRDDGDDGAVIIGSSANISTAGGVIAQGEGSKGTVEVVDGTWTNTTALTIGNAGEGTLSISGNGRVVAPSVSVTAANASGKGLLEIDGMGVLEAGQVSAGVGQATLSFSNRGTLRLTGDQSDLFTGFKAQGVRFDTGGGVIDTQEHTATIDISLWGEGALIKRGSGTLVLTGANSHAGGTVVEEGVLSIGLDANLGASGPLTLDGGTLLNRADILTARKVRLGENGGVLDVDAGFLTFEEPVEGMGDLTKTGGNLLTLVGHHTYTGDTHVNEGGFKLQDGTLASSLVELAEGTTFYLVAHDGKQTAYAGEISGDGQVVIQTDGSGQVVLSGDNRHAGPTTIESGELVTLSDGALSPLSALTLLEGTKLIVYGDDDDSYLVEAGSLSGAGTVEIGKGSGLIVGGDNSDTTFSGSILATGPGTGFEKTGAGKLTLTGDSEVSILMLCGCSLTNELEINGGSVTSVEFLENFGGALSVVNGGRLEADIVLSFGPLRVRDNGSQMVAGAMSFAGEDAILEVGEGASLSTASVTISEGAQAVVNGTVQGLVENNTSLYVEEGAIVSGSGTIGELEIDDGGILSPGNSLGTLTASNTTWLSGGVYLWEINDATGAAGTNWDLFNVNGTLSLADISADNRFTIALRSLGLDDNPGEAANFDPTRTYTWTIVMASGGITDFDAAGFSIDSSGFANAPGSNRFSLSSDGARLTLTYSAVPEPAHIGLGIGTLLLALAAMRRRRA